MGRRFFYRPGSWYRQDDRTGFPRRAEDTRQQWNGIIVGEDVWEPRQPQDLVKGVKDDQSVPQARPKPPTTYVGPIYSQLAASGIVGQTELMLTSVDQLMIGDALQIMLDTGAYWSTQILDIEGYAVQISFGLPSTAAANNVVVDWRISGDVFTNIVIGTENDLPIGLEGGGDLGVES